MKYLYFIGNGFDLHHGFDTRYVWWSTFEAHLVDFDIYDDIVEIARENSINYGADDFSEGDRYSGGIEAEQKFEETMSKILGYFGNWVDSLGDLYSDIKIGLDEDADFINFNYTLTLEELYNVPADRVHHLHGKLGDETYILGHGRSYRDIDKSIRDNEPPPPKNLPEEELDDWYAEQWDEAYENTVGYTASKLASYKKDTDRIIKANEELFDAMTDLECITIYGCSFSVIDTPYFSEAISRVKNKNKLMFVVNWHSQKDLDNIDKFFKSEGIADDMVEKIKLDEITTIREK